MLSKGFRIIWVKISVDYQKHIHLHFPVPLYVFQELLDCSLDLLAVAGLFVPKVPDSYKSPSFSIHAAKEVVRMLLKLFDSFTEREPYDLVEVNNENVKVSIRIR